MQLRPIRYRNKPDNGMCIRDSEEHIGVVAQEAQRVIPEAVTENARGYLLVNDEPIIWSMVNAIKEQQRKIEEQRKLLWAEDAANEKQASILRAQARLKPPFLGWVDGTCPFKGESPGPKGLRVSLFFEG